LQEPETINSHSNTTGNSKLIKNIKYIPNAAATARYERNQSNVIVKQHTTYGTTGGNQQFQEHPAKYIKSYVISHT